MRWYTKEVPLHKEAITRTHVWWVGVIGKIKVLGVKIKYYFGF
ncbi:MAG: hypothetical protein UW45_C0015G0017 [Parcubacteria group bacterium GW2011_GWC2_44_22]|nr:MAG: hypothetical protein UW45_C0015G0017 [Parcubacteria group bacterium GW2011_GWC2_44_22]